MGAFDFFTGSPGISRTQAAVQQNAATAAQNVQLSVEAKRKKVGADVEAELSTLRASLTPGLKDIQRGLLSRQSQGRSALVSNLARLGVRSGGAAKRIGQFEAGATADLARSEFGSKLKLEDFLQRTGQIKRAELLGDISAADAAAQSVQLRSGTSDLIKGLLQPVAGAALGAFLGPIGKRAGASLGRLGSKAATGIFGDSFLTEEPGQIA